MKRALVLFFVAFLFWGIAPAGANSVPRIDIACDSVTVTWSNFPARPVDLTVTLMQRDEVTVASVSTDGAVDGEAVVPANFADGPASAEVAWTLQKEHHAGPVTADLHCTTTTSTTTSTSTPSTSPTTGPTTTTNPPECSADTLACTGGGANTALIVGGWSLIGFGALLLFTTRRRAR